MDSLEKADLALCEQGIMKFPALENFKPVNINSLKCIVSTTKAIVEVLKSKDIAVYQKNGLVYFLSIDSWEEYINPFVLRIVLSKAAIELGVDMVKASCYEWQTKLLKQFLYGFEVEAITPTSSNKGFQNLIKDIEKKENAYFDYKAFGIKALRYREQLYLRSYFQGLQMRELLLRL